MTTPTASTPATVVTGRLGRPSSPGAHPAPLLPELLVSTTYMGRTRRVQQHVACHQGHSACHVSVPAFTCDVVISDKYLECVNWVGCELSRRRAEMRHSHESTTLQQGSMKRLGAHAVSLAKRRSNRKQEEKAPW